MASNIGRRTEVDRERFSPTAGPRVHRGRTFALSRRHRTTERRAGACARDSCGSEAVCPTQQPNDLDVAMTFGFKPAAGSHPLEIAADVKLRQIARRVAWTAGNFRLDPLETSGFQIEPVDEGVDEPHRVVDAEIIVNRLRQKQELRAFEAGDMPDSNRTPPPTESRQSDFSQGLEDLCTKPSPLMQRGFSCAEMTCISRA